jgi:hypothetical protein
MAINSATNSVFLNNLCLGEVWLINGSTNRLVKNITTTFLPLAFGSGMGYSLAVNTKSNTLNLIGGGQVFDVVNGSKNYAVTSIPIAISVSAIAVNSNTGKIYLADDGARGLLVINGKNQWENPILVNYTSAQYSVYGLSVDDKSNLIYLMTVSQSPSVGANITVIDGYSDRIIDTVMLDKMGITDRAIT